MMRNYNVRVRDLYTGEQIDFSRIYEGDKHRLQDIISDVLEIYAAKQHKDREWSSSVAVSVDDHVDYLYDLQYFAVSKTLHKDAPATVNYSFKVLSYFGGDDRSLQNMANDGGLNDHAKLLNFFIEDMRSLHHTVADLKDRLERQEENHQRLEGELRQEIEDLKYEVRSLKDSL